MVQWLSDWIFDLRRNDAVISALCGLEGIFVLLHNDDSQTRLPCRK